MNKLTYTKIKDRQQYEQYCRKLEELCEIDESGEEENLREHIELLTLLIEHWEGPRKKIEDPVRLLKSFRDEHKMDNAKLARIAGLRPEDVDDIFERQKDIPGYAGQRLADYFKMQPDTFNQ